MKKVFELKGKPAGMTFEHFTGYLASTTQPKRVLTLNEMANVAAFVASDKASGLTGTNVNLTMGSLTTSGYSPLPAEGRQFGNRDRRMTL